MATTYQSPGVYVEEVPPGSRPIEGVGTALAAFVGLTETGPLHEPKLVTNWTQFTNTFGGFTSTGYTPLSVYHYFNNGGTACYVVRVGGGDSEAGALPQPPSATISSASKADVPSIEITAKAADPAARISVEVQPQLETDEDVLLEWLSCLFSKC